MELGLITFAYLLPETTAGTGLNGQQHIKIYWKKFNWQINLCPSGVFAARSTKKKTIAQNPDV